MAEPTGPQASDEAEKAAAAAQKAAQDAKAASEEVKKAVDDVTETAGSAATQAKQEVGEAADKAVAAKEATVAAKETAAAAKTEVTSTAKTTAAGAAGAAKSTATAAAGAAGAAKPGTPGAAAAKSAAAGAAAGTSKPAGAAARPAASKEEAPPAAPPKAVTRREFLNYVWGASIALFLAQFTGITFLFAMPRFRAGEFGGVITVSLDTYPPVNDPPVPNNVGKFWKVNVDNPGHKGIAALYKICTHLGCIYFWSDSAGIFACPCHGSQFQLDGKYIAGPAPRSLDRFSFQVLDANGNVLVDSPDGEFVQVPGDAASVAVNTGNKIPGASHF